MKNSYPRDLFPALFGAFLASEVGAILMAFCYPFKAVYIVSAVVVLFMGTGALMAYFLSIRKVLRQYRQEKPR
jgi:hypothetical protein